MQKTQSPRRVFTGVDNNLSNISKNYLDDFDDNISGIDGRRSKVANSNNRFNAMNQGTARKTKMSSRNDIYNLDANTLKNE